MELRQLRYFIAVADTLNFSRAAESLYISQSALSKQISELEQELGVQLLERDRRNVRLTGSGELLLSEGKAILMRTEKLLPLLRHEAAPAPQERSFHAGLDSAANDCALLHQALTEAVYRQRKDIPGLRSLFWDEELPALKKRLLDGSLDLGVFLSREARPDEGLETAILLEERIVLAFRSDRTFSDDLDTLRRVLDQRGLILLEKETRVLSWSLQLLDQIGSAPQIRFARDRAGMLLTMESGESAVLLPESAVRRLEHPRLRVLHFPSELGRLYFLAAWDPAAQNELTSRVLETAQSFLAAGGFGADRTGDRNTN